MHGKTIEFMIVSHFDASSQLKVEKEMNTISHKDKREEICHVYNLYTLYLKNRIQWFLYKFTHKEKPWMRRKAKIKRSISSKKARFGWEESSGRKAESYLQYSLSICRNVYVFDFHRQSLNNIFNFLGSWSDYQTIFQCISS